MLELLAAAVIGCAASFYAAPTHALIAGWLYPVTASFGGHRPESFVFPFIAIMAAHAALVAFLVLAAAGWLS